MVKRKKREDSWVLVFLLMLFTSLVIAVSGIYVADKLWRMSLNEEYNCYIQKTEEDRKGSILRYNDGIYRSEIRNVFSEYEFEGWQE